MIVYNSVYYKNTELKLLSESKLFLDMLVKLHPHFCLYNLSNLKKSELILLLGDYNFYYNDYVRHFVWVKKFNNGVLFINHSSDSFFWEYQVFKNKKESSLIREVFFFLYSLSKRALKKL